MQTRTALLALLASLPSGAAYITSHGAVPFLRQQQWLKEMTVNICESPPGALTQDEIKRVPDLMDAWSHSRKADKESALAVESLLKRIVDEQASGNAHAVATTEDYNCLLEGWARSKAGVTAAERTEQIVAEMEERYKQSGDTNVQPNLQSFKSVLLAWKVSGVAYAPFRAQRVLDWMIRMAQSGENPAVLPDANCFDIVMQLWSRSGNQEAPEKTEQLLKTMEQLYQAAELPGLRPRTGNYNSVLAAWSRSNAKGSADRAADILAFMEYRANNGENAMAPDQASYTAVVNALMKSGGRSSAQRADEILKNAEESATGAPDTILYNTVIGCWARSNQSAAYRKARSILDRQLDNYEKGNFGCRPDVYGFTSVIASCAMEPGSVQERTKAFHVALGAFQQLSKYDKPNHVTYGTMLKACARLLPGDFKLRHRWARRIFKQAIEDGFVGDMVVNRMREAVSPPIYRELMQGYKKQTMPESWSRNVQEKNEYRNKKSSGKQKPGRRAEV